MYSDFSRAKRRRVDNRGTKVRTAPSTVILSALRERISRLEGGARLPTVRDLMRSHRVSQATVQEALNLLRAEGLISSQVGRGTYVVKDGEGGEAAAPSAHIDSLLILSNASLNQRCVLVQDHIVGELSKTGSKVVQISYHDTGQLLDILTSIPDFDAAILQSHYESIPVRLLHLLQDKTRALVVDGHTISGVDIDRIGTDWEEALDIALEHLAELGHRSVGLVTLPTMAQPILSVRRAFERIGRRHRAQWPHLQSVILDGVLYPTQSVGAALKDALQAQRDDRGRLPFTAMITLAISDALGVQQCLADMRIGVPKDLSVFMLGHRDVPGEHFGAMTMAGSSYLQAAQQLIKVIRHRIASPDAPAQVVYLDCREAIHDSTGPAPKG